MLFKKNRSFKIVDHIFINKHIFLVLKELKIEKDSHYNAF